MPHLANFLPRRISRCVASRGRENVEEVGEYDPAFNRTVLFFFDGGATLFFRRSDLLRLFVLEPAREEAAARLRLFAREEEAA